VLETAAGISREVEAEFQIAPHHNEAD
jgi:hypothetical protein